MTAEEKKTLKGEGFLCNRDGVYFNARVITGNGVISSEGLTAVAQAARRHGNGQVALTSRMTLEIMGVPYEHIEPLKEELAQAGLETGGTGAKVRPVVACKGTVCVFGLIDTQTLGQELHERFYKGWRQVKLPHKFKIAVGGCPNNCVKPDLNDIGIVGQRIPEFHDSLCRGCKKCAIEAACPCGAVSRRDDGRISINQDACSQCGRCVGKCPFKAVPDGKVGYKIYIGGRWGKKTRMGTALKGIYTREQAVDMVEKAILLFKREAEPGERFGSLVERLGTERVQALLDSDELMKQKEEILARE